MSPYKRATRSDLQKIDAHEIRADEYDDAPELTDEQIAAAFLCDAGNAADNLFCTPDKIGQTVEVGVQKDEH